MCGLAGIFTLRPSAARPEREALARMAAVLHHRGPDEHGIYLDSRTGLAHARLAIIDPSGGQQPLANEDGTLVVVFNGEIFNYSDLREDLERRGHRFRTASDTEVLVHGYEEWSDSLFERINGQWAVALWDSWREKLVLSRDRLGVRPLYTCEHAGRLYFASEVKALFAADRSIPRQLDPAAISQTFTFWSVLAPRSAFTGVESLVPGHVRTYEGGSMRELSYWQPQFPDETTGEGRFSGSIDDAAAAVRTMIECATSLRALRSDVPVGSYLSGGLDSSIVAALAARARGGRLRTFSIRFEDREYDETPYQRAMVEALGSEHLDVLVSRADIAAVFPEVVVHAEQPLLRTAPAPLFMLSRLVRQAGLKVVLTGEGADEIFAGYDIFREGKVRRFWAKQPHSKLRPKLLGRLYPYLARSPMAQQAMAEKFFGRNLDAWRAPGFAHGPRWQSASALKRLLARDVVAAGGADPVVELLASVPPGFDRWSWLARDQYLEMRTILSGYLLSAQGDRMLMANSVEGRFPFLDKDVVALASSLPADYKLRVLDEKHVLKVASRGLVPAAIVARQKQPYRAPDAACFTGAAAPDWIGDVLSEKTLEDAGIFDVGAVSKLRHKCLRSGPSALFSNSDNMAVVGVLSTQLLHAHFIKDSCR